VAPNVSGTYKDYKWYNSLNIPFEVQCGLCRLDLPADVHVTSPEVPDLYFTAHVVCNQMPMHECPVSSFFSSADEQRNCLVWDYVLNFPLRVRDLSLDSILVLTAWTPQGKVYGGTTMKFFDEFGALKRGKQKLVFYFGVPGDPTCVLARNTTLGETYRFYEKWDYRFKMEKDLEAYGTAQAAAARAGGGDARQEWLDRLALSRMQTCLEDPRGFAGPSPSPTTGGGTPTTGAGVGAGRAPEEIDLDSFCFLVLELPLLQHPVLHEEKQYPSVTHTPPQSHMERLSGLVVSDNDAIMEFSLIGRPFSATFLTIVADWDMDQENLAEDLNRKLTQHSRRGAGDTTAKPNKAERERVDKVVTAVGSHMSTDEIDLLYKFRYSLTENKRALVKFLHAVNWEEASEVAEVPALLALWSRRAPIEVEDALKLLSREKCFEHPCVREYAVGILQTASDDELLSFLLQLVQALRYEPSPAVSSTLPSTLPSTSASATASATAAAAATGGGISGGGVDIGELAGPVSTLSIASSVGLSLESQNEGLSLASNGAAAAGPGVDTPDFLRSAGALSPLADFLITRACASPVVANYLYWYLKVETEDEPPGMPFQTVFDSFIVQLSTSGLEGRALFRRLCALDDYIDKIATCQRDAREQGRRKEGKEQVLQKLLAERQLSSIPRGVDWVPMPLDPKVRLCGLVPGTASMFASAVYPCVIEFLEYDEEDAVGGKRTHKIMFKSGDDLRQDQLIMQLISLMDRLLKKVNLDLKLLTYGILAVGQNDGLMEFVRSSMPISAVLKTYNNSIADYLRHHRPDKAGPYEIAASALDTFVKSCAGYCVITYILGIGDRHLDNIMINTSGQMFHIDFGFIFGQDPKPMPPPFRFTRQMADAMGGEDSEHYARFKTFCCQSYNWLRKSANLILNLLSLMGDAGIQDISKRSELSKVLLKVEEKFRLDLTDEQAEQFFLALINESLHSLAPRIMEVAHKIAVSMR